MFSHISDIHQQQQTQLRLQYAQQQQEYTEDKKCRICGFADTKNVNIFSDTSCKALATKILTVYPIVLYKNDPLPKNICKKCVCNVSIMYNDILRVMKTQSKWIKNVRNVQPQHNYIRVLEMIENSNNVTKGSIKTSLGEEINELSIERLLLSNTVDPQLTENINSIKQNTSQKVKASTQNDGLNKSSLSFSMDYDDGIVRKVSHPTTAKNKESTEMNDIKSLLEHNGCSLLQVGADKTMSQTSTNLTSNADDATTIKIKQEKMDMDLRKSDENEKIDFKTPQLTSKNTTSAIYPGPPPPLTIKCRLCPLQFNSLNSLASHQVIHMRLCVPKIFQKKYLHKKVRRGRLIAVNDRKCIRCLNCWRVFADNKSILEHWALGECDFYCHICGKEFAQAPKMLREHVPAAHGISYKSSKFHRVRLSTKIMSSQTTLEENHEYKHHQTSLEKEALSLDGQGELSKEKTLSMKAATSATTYNSTQYRKTLNSGLTASKASSYSNEAGSVACHICNKVFQNFKARNSHMRKHKPVYAYGDMVLPPLQGVNVYMNEQTKNNEFKYRAPSSTDIISQQQTTYQNYDFSPTAPNVPTSSLPTPPLSSSPQTVSIANSCNKPSGAVRGVRTKFVQPREVNGVGGLKVKPLNELQKQSSSNVFDSTQNFSNIFSPPSSTAVTSNSWLSSTLAAPSNQDFSTIVSFATKIKEEPKDSDLKDSSMQHQLPTVFTCIPCSDEFPSKLELFRHKKKCRAAYSFTCIYCSALFRCSADYQLHVTQVHNNSNTN